MGKEQDLLQAVKSADVQTTHKLLSKLKTNRSSKYTPTHWRLRPRTSSVPIAFLPLASLADHEENDGGWSNNCFTIEVGGVPTETCGGSSGPRTL